MAIVGMSGKTESKSEITMKIIDQKTEVVVRPDTTWYDPNLCNRPNHQCPYFEMDDITQMAKCHKPYGENCLGESMLVQAMLMREQYLKITKQLDEIDEKLTDEAVKAGEPISSKAKSRKRKRIKCRRGGYL